MDSVAELLDVFGQGASGIGFGENAVLNQAATARDVGPGDVGAVLSPIALRC